MVDREGPEIYAICVGKNQRLFSTWQRLNSGIQTIEHRENVLSDKQNRVMKKMPPPFYLVLPIAYCP
jgi:hypothetical protein